MVVHGRHELISPVPQPIPDRDVAALRRRFLVLRPHQQIVEVFGTWLHPQRATSHRP